MNETVKSLKMSKSARWLVLACLVVPMFASYFFDDSFSSLSQLFQTPNLLALGWNSKDYGFYAGGYSFLSVWGGLILCGMLLDKWGVRVTGSLFLGLIIVGASIVAYAISGRFASSGLCAWMSTFIAKPSIVVAYIGCMIFGLGNEITNVAITRSIAKWFKGKEMALAMGLQLSIARLGSGLAFIVSPLLVVAGNPDAKGIIYSFWQTQKPALCGIGIMLVGAVLWSVFITMDFKLDKQTGATDKKEVSEEDKFKFSDIFKILTNKHYIYISLLCVFFYCCIVSFMRFATAILMPRFNIPVDVAKWMVALIPFFTVLFTPLFGSLVDYVGKGTKWMITGAGLVLLSHILIAFSPNGVQAFGYIAISLLGIGYSLVPAAMWPSIPKIVPEKNLGTAYSLIFWIQNIGLLLAPVLIGIIFNRNVIDANSMQQKLTAARHAEYLFLVLGAAAVAVSLLLSRSSKKHPELQLDMPNKQRKK